jgi:hypothetical protein
MKTRESVPTTPPPEATPSAPRRIRAKLRLGAPRTAAPSSPPGYEDLVTKLSSLAESLRGIQELGVAQYTAVVEAILRTRSRDVRHIEHTLDHLLDFACHPAGLELYRRLCRHYWDIDPAATAEYVNAYRELWDHEDAEDKTP